MIYDSFFIVQIGESINKLIADNLNNRYWKFIISVKKIAVYFIKIYFINELHEYESKTCRFFNKRAIKFVNNLILKIF